MATTNYNVNVNTTQAVAAMTRLQQSASRVNSVFGGLKTAIGGLALGAAISSALRYADAINDIAEATGIGTANILGFSRAVAANGGSAESAQASILRLSQSIDDAATGSDKMRSQFAQVGVSLQDLATLSEQDILNKTVAGLAKIEDNSKRIALATDILGKSARGINFAGVAASLPGAIAQSQQYAASQKAAAELQDKLNYSIDQFRMSLLKALGPLITFLNTLKPEQIDKFVDAVVKIGGAAVAITAVGTAISKVLPLLTSLGGIAASAFLLFRTGAAQATKTVLNLGIRWNGFLKAFGKADSIFGKIVELFRHLGFHATKTLPFLIGGFLRMIPGIGLVTSALYALNEIISLVFNYDPLAKFIQGLKNIGAALGIISPEKEFKVTEGVGTGSGPRGSIGTGRAAEEERKTLNAERKLGESDLDRKKKSLQGITAEFAKQSRAIAEAIVNEAGYINLSEDQVEVLKAQDEVYKRLAESVKDLEQQKIGLKDEDKKLIPVINAQIAALEKQAKVDANMIAASVQALQGQRLLEQDRLANIERITAAMERQQNMADALNQIRKDGAQALADAEAEGAQAGLTEMQRQVDQIIRSNDKAARAASESFAKMFEGMDLTSQQSQELANGLDLIAKNYEKLTYVQINNLNKSKDFITGWREAFNEFADAATNAATQASNIFQTATKGMEDMIVNFARTGKLEFKSFLGSIVEQLLRSQIQQLIAKSFGGLNLFGGGGGGSLFPALFGLPGFANGGIIGSNGPVVVGERGPEILTGAAGRSVIPNEALGGSTNVTYNINAVDASSFRNLVASDPEFIFAVTEQGRRRQPGQRR
jgi:lambda family phage tail tape measure protein